MSDKGWPVEEPKSRTVASIGNVGNRRFWDTKKMGASARLGLGLIARVTSFCVSVEYGGIPCIEVSVSGETHVSATKLERLCDAVSKNTSSTRIQHRLSNRLLDIPR